MSPDLIIFGLSAASAASGYRTGTYFMTFMGTGTYPKQFFHGSGLLSVSDPNPDSNMDLDSDRISYSSPNPALIFRA
jgi:hypothetical protein